MVSSAFFPPQPLRVLGDDVGPQVGEGLRVGAAEQEGIEEVGQSRSQGAQLLFVHPKHLHTGVEVF